MMQTSKTHEIRITDEPDEIERLLPLIEDILILKNAAEASGGKTKAPIVDSCRYDLESVMHERSDDRHVPPGDILDLLAQYGLIRKEGETFHKLPE